MWPSFELMDQRAQVDLGKPEDKRSVGEECGLTYGALSSIELFEAKEGDKAEQSRLTHYL